MAEPTELPEDRFQIFREAMNIASENLSGSKRLQDRYPPELLEEMKAASQKILDHAMSVAGGEIVDSDKDAHLELMIESDRGCVLIAAAWIDELVTDIVSDILCSGTDEMKKAGGMLISGLKAPLGDAWSRETFLFAVGAISESERNGLSALRKLRNKYAHRKAPAVITENDIHPFWSTLSERSRAKLDLLGEQFGLVFKAAGEADDMPFGARFFPSAAKLKFVMAFSTLKTSIQLARARAPMSAAMLVLTRLVDQKREAREKAPPTATE